MSISQNLINNEKNGKHPKQKTDIWYETRQNMLTASEVASVLDCNIYETSYDLLIKKLSPIEYKISTATEWGNLFEPVAIKLYEHIKKVTVYSLGLVTHSNYNWIGASPDGLIMSGRLLEIKCPINRIIGKYIPLYYWIQMQIQMEVCNLDVCDYFECKFHKYLDIDEYKSDISKESNKNVYNLINFGTITFEKSSVENIYYKVTDFYLKSVKRDKKWFECNINKLKYFYDNMMYYRGISNGIHKFKIDSKNYITALASRINDMRINPTQKSIHYKCIKKRPREEIYNQKGQFINWSNWVSASRIRNYMIDDPIIDWLNLYSEKVVTEQNSIQRTNKLFQRYIMDQGIAFEENIINIIKERFSNDVVTIANNQEAKSHDRFIETINSIKKKVPIIYQGVLHDYDYYIFGIPDLIVRCDYINKIFNMEVIKNPSKISYRIIEIKSSLLNLCANGKNLRNDKHINAYKGQLYIYNKILGKIQNKTPTKSYILGKNWQYVKCKKYFSGTSFERPAHIDFKHCDSFIRLKTAKAIRWIRDLNTNGHKWEVYSRDELKPNMCNIDDQWQSVKKSIAEKYNDITLLWYCGIKNRKIAEQNNIKNWKTHNNLTSELIGVSGDKIASTLQLFIDLNQTNKIDSLIVPEKITNNMFNWRKIKKNRIVFNDFFIDFETIIPNIINNPSITTAFIFMIGVGTINKKDQWGFKCFTADTLTLEGEKNMLVKFHDYIENYNHDSITTVKKRLWHWGNVEQSLYISCINRHPDILSKYVLLTDWCDMLKLFKDECIITRGMLNFSLKSVVNAFHNNGYINTSYEGLDVNNGLDAMIRAFESYNLYSDIIMKNIKKYNEIDCKVIWEILQFLRNHYK